MNHEHPAQRAAIRPCLPGIPLRPPALAPRLLGGLLLALTAGSAAIAQAAPQKASTTPSQLADVVILSDTLRYDDAKHESVFTGNVVLTRGQMTLTADEIRMREDDKGNQFGIATAASGKTVRLRDERLADSEVIAGEGLRAEYNKNTRELDLIGEATITRYVCDAPFDSVHGQRVRYDEKTFAYRSLDAPDASGPGGRTHTAPSGRAAAKPAKCPGSPPAKPGR